MVSVDEAYYVAYRYVLSLGAAQTPQPWLSAGEGVIVLGRSRAGQVPGLHRRCAQRLPFRKLIALPGDAGRACRPHGIGLGGRLRAQA